MVVEPSVDRCEVEEIGRRARGKVGGRRALVEASNNVVDNLEGEGEQREGHDGIQLELILLYSLYERRLRCRIHAGETTEKLKQARDEEEQLL